MKHLEINGSETENCFIMKYHIIQIMVWLFSVMFRLLLNFIIKQNVLSGVDSDLSCTSSQQTSEALLKESKREMDLPQRSGIYLSLAQKEASCPSDTMQEAVIHQRPQQLVPTHQNGDLHWCLRHM